jgi:hypothetical protein
MTIEEHSEHYIQETYAWSKANPRIFKDMLIEVWNHDDPMHPIYCGKGRVLKTDWDNYYKQWMVDFEMTWQGKLQKYCTFAGCCEVYKKRALRAIK